MGKPHPSVRRHRLLKAPGHVISSVVATSSLATTNQVQKSARSQASSAGVDIDDADAVHAVEAFNATSSSSNTELEEEDEQQQRFVGKS